jgi:16S rRNA (guanine527-N7)-methyltransferase
LADDVSALGDILPVSRETGERLKAFVALLEKWQPAENLISAKTLPEIWRRHVADSAQLFPMFPETRTWLDMGTGAGFPGMVVAILGVERAGTEVFLVESNRRKCAFLRQAIRETGAPAKVLEGRVEDVLPGVARPERVIARAVAPLVRLLELAEPLMGQGVPAAFHKGLDFQAEIDAAAQSFAFDLVRHDSKLGEGGVILEISALRRKPNQGT